MGQQVCICLDEKLHKQEYIMQRLQLSLAETKTKPNGKCLLLEPARLLQFFFFRCIIFLLGLIPFLCLTLHQFPSISLHVTLFLMDSSESQQRKDAHQTNPHGRSVVRVTKSLMVPNWDRAVCST